MYTLFNYRYIYNTQLINKKERKKERRIHSLAVRPEYMVEQYCNSLVNCHLQQGQFLQL